MKLRPSVLLAALAVARATPAVAQTDTVRQSTISFTSGALTLQGTVTLPGGPGPWPAVVIIAGSGPTDRDGNSASGVATNMYALLSRGLAERGIASLRYDKRGLPSSAGPFDTASTTLGDYAADVAAAARLMDARDDVGPVFLLGHSEGGTLAMLATRSGAPVAGLVLVSTAGRDATTILREQLGRQLSPALLAQFDTAWVAYLRDDPSLVPPPALAPLFVAAHRRFLQSWQEIRPVELLAGLGKPTLVVQGENDLQVTPADARALGSARPDVRLVILPGVNHVLKLASGQTAEAQLAAYTDPSLPLAPTVVPTIADWILATRR